MDWLRYLMIFGSIQGLVLSIGLISVKKPRVALINRLFATLVILISAFLFTHSQAGFFIKHTKLFMLSYVFLFCYTPIFHLFLRLLGHEKLVLKRKDLLYLVPLAIYLITLSRYLLMPTEVLMQHLRADDLMDMAISDILALSFNFYFIHDSWKRLKNKETEWTKAQMWPLKTFWLMILFSNVSWMLLALPRLGLEIGITTINFAGVWTLNAFLIFFFTYFVVVRSDLFMAAPIRQAAYKNINRNQQEFELLESEVLQVMQTQKPYLNPEFSLSDLSELCGVDKFKLSMAINQGMKTSFFNLVNQYRVEEFMRLAHSEAHANFSLLGIAQESGFKSKSTFYKVFREMKGQTPKEYLNTHMKAS